MPRQPRDDSPGVAHHVMVRGIERRALVVEDSDREELLGQLSTLLLELGFRRVGHLFQNRFRSRRVVDDADLLGLVLYVFRNPLEAGLVRDLDALGRFPWCSAGSLLGYRAPRPFED